MRTRRGVLSLLLALSLFGTLLLPGTSAAAPSSPGLDQFWRDAMGATSQALNLAFAPLPLQRTLLAKAQPDECFDGVGKTYPLQPDGTCPGTSRPKVNEAYVWGLARAGDTLWFGTAPNVHCLVLGGYLGQTTPVVTSDGGVPAYVCEFGESVVAKQLRLPAAIGDWRPPHIYTRDLVSGKLVDKGAVDPALKARLGRTLGLRSAGANNGVVYLAGPSLGAGIDVYAFNASTGAWLGTQNLPAFDNIRKWLVHNGVLYTAVHRTAGGGSVLRWTGTTSSPFTYDTVGVIDADGAELAVHDGRLYVSTWPDGNAVAGLWMSPPIPGGGLTAAQANGWKKVWDVNAYEPDPVTARTYGGGALASYGGALYWGTMHVPFVATLANLQAYPRPIGDQAAVFETIQGTHRAITIFRGDNFDTARPKTEVLYGERNLPVYSPTEGWQTKRTKMGAPLYGPSGFGNAFNNYTWTMGVYNNQLFVGTMDWSMLFRLEVPRLSQLIFGVPVSGLPSMPPVTDGADLYRFLMPGTPALPESLNGLGNYANYGIRTMLVSNDGLYLGTSNPMNLLTDETDRKPEGGWELIRLKSAFPF